MNTSHLTGNDIIAFTVSNLLALLVAANAKKHEKLAKVMLSVIFGLAGVVNLFLACSTPAVYLTFADAAIAPYQQFIYGPFAAMIRPIVTVAAIGQFMIAVAMWSKTIFYTMGCFTGALFCLAIAPLGWGAAFPSTLLLTFAFLRLHTNNRYITPDQS